MSIAISDDLMPFSMKKENSSIIKVLGVGGGGCNAVNYMFQQGIRDVDFIVTNTDSQALENSPVPLRIQLGAQLTEGRGAGNLPEIGKQAAIENITEIKEILANNTKMVFITAGMGGGTGTGAAPVIAKAARELNILTVGIVTLPFRFEGQRRQRQAIQGIKELKNNVDSLLIINNEKLREIHGDLKIADAFGKADNVLTVAARGIAEIITVHGHINVDFADVKTVMKNSGVALMGSGLASGENRALDAIEQALTSPLLNNNDIHGAKNILLNISSGVEEASMDEIGQINDYVQESAGYSADLIWGSSTDSRLGDKLSVTVIATGFKTDIFPEFNTDKEEEKKVVHLEKPKKEVTNKYALEGDDDINRLFGSDSSSSEEIYIEESSSARVREFNLVEEEEEFIVEERTIAENNTKPSERIETLKHKEKPVKQFHNAYAENIDEWENIPAYKRKNLDLKKVKASEKISRTTLYEDEDKNQRIKTNNSYLHDRVD